MLQGILGYSIQEDIHSKKEMLTGASETHPIKAAYDIEVEGTEHQRPIQKGSKIGSNPNTELR